MIGATKSDQLDDNLSADDLKLTAPEIAARGAARSIDRSVDDAKPESYGEYHLVVDRLIDRGPEVEINS